MIGLQQTVSRNVVGMGSGIDLLEEKIVSKSWIDRQKMWVKDFIQVALACKCVPNYMQAKLTDLFITLLYNSQGDLPF